MKRYNSLNNYKQNVKKFDKKKQFFSNKQNELLRFD